MDTKPLSLYDALFHASKELQSIPKDALGQFGGYASLDQVTGHVKPILAKYGLFIVHTTFVLDGKNLLRTSLIHSASKEQLNSDWLLCPEKQTPQGYGAALTYAKRYSTMGICGLATEDDPDAHKPVSAPSREYRLSPLGGPPIPFHDDRTPEFSEEAKNYISDASKRSLIKTDLLNWVIPFGRFKGLSLSKVPLDELVRYTKWLENDSKQKGEAVSRNGQEFIAKVQALQEGSLPSQDFAPNNDVPF